MKLLVLVHNRFNDTELASVLSTFEKSGEFDEFTFYNPNYIKAQGQHGIINLSLENDFDFKSFDAIFIPGGAGAKELRNDKISLELIKKFKNDNKYIFAICDAPNVLYENGIIDDNMPYSSFPIESIDSNSGKLRNEELATCHEKIFTGKSAASSITFALLIIKKLFGDYKYETLKKALFGDR
ncbi:DJ-1/PfpI family protein [Mycoplasma tauri]|uniref:DJ-1/PfpI family protein n=1 Tax=Mycoplasma tauri TaxID=547987 RepID=A0A953T3W6_9MOLU|nr:DJ-1/PfpI family protein [Mycoplasma tauri]MBZ4195523.1 DJ-1/PfpI family protein [Mycoplasma tauri]MBZ4204310.1 DJ-1/PfpI family protein [Mycoplasma tauri]MBZ4212837.1 DJ-1/PfpI family protein [Mycoplasma tauri]MBZ4218378.1 DJ-1/PfpI family protein [Mycoplasma tauri]MBZ4226576.1 DJ-1/PfpI family protein [Mycoplasma tauri]